MTTTVQEHGPAPRGPDPQWKDLYRIGFVSSVALAAAIVIAVIVYFIWPYQPGFTTVEQIFTDLHNNRLEGLLSIEISVLFVDFLLTFQALALYVALKRVNPSYALTALVLEIMGIVFFLVARPVVEMVYLSEQYAAATGELAQSRYLAAGEAFSALFNGTAWMWGNILIPLAGVIQSLLMLRSNTFGKAAAYTGLTISVVAFGILSPVFALTAVAGLGSTIGAVIWDLQLARAFYRLGWDRQRE